MKRDFLKNLGIEDKDIIDKILDENSSDIGRAKGELDTYKTKVSELESQLNDKNDEIKTLKANAEEVETLKQTVTQLETDKSNLTTELNTKVTQLKKDHAVVEKIREVKGKNVKAIMALLDMEKIKYENEELSGIDEQLTSLASAEDSSMLFGDSNPTPPAGTHFNNPPAGNNGGTPPVSKTLAEAISKAMSK